MPITIVQGDPLLTRAHMLAVGHNQLARIEMSNLDNRLLQTYPAAYSAFRRQCKQDRIKAGTHWIWRDAVLPLVFMVVRDSSVGATRLRYVQSICIRLAQDYRLEGIRSLAVAPLGAPGEWNEIKNVLHTWFQLSDLPVVVYDEYIPDVRADESL